MSQCYIYDLGFKNNPYKLLSYNWVLFQMLWFNMWLSVMIDDTESDTQ